MDSKPKNQAEIYNYVKNNDKNHREAHHKLRILVINPLCEYD